MSGPRLSIIPARAATDPALKPRDLQVLCVLGRHTDDLGWCRRSQVKMADEMGCGRATVFDAMERLIKAGYVERFVHESDNGRDSAHSYRVILDPKHADPEAIPVEPDGPEAGENDGSTPAGRAAPPAGLPAPPAGSGPAPINDPSSTVERERARENQKEAERWQKRVHPKWPTYVTDSEPEVTKAAMALTAEERAEAEDRMPDYVAAAKSAKTGGRTVLCSFGKYLAEKRWERLEPKPAAKPVEQLAAAFGKAFMAARFKVLCSVTPAALPPLTWSERALVADGRASEPDLMKSKRARFGWPSVNFMHTQAAQGRGISVGPAIEALGASFEAVRVGSDVWMAWQAEHERQGWPWLPDPGGQQWVYFPAGGPAGLDAFEQMVRS